MSHKPAARHSAFYWNTGEPSVFLPLQTAANLRAASSAKVEQARASDADRPSIHNVGIAKRQRYSAPVEGAAAGQRASDRRNALRRGSI